MIVDTAAPTPAEQATTPTAAPETRELSLREMNPEQRLEWRKTGKSPSRPADSAPADKSHAAPSQKEGETAPESEPDEQVTQEISAKEQRGETLSKAEKRIKQLLAKNKELTKKLESSSSRREEPQQPAAAQPPPAPPSKVERPTRPKVDEFAGDWEKYDTALDKYYEELSEYKAHEAVAKDRTDRARAEAQKHFDTQVVEARKRYADFDSVIKPVMTELMKPEVPEPVRAMLNSSPVLMDLLYVMGGKADDLADFIATAKADTAGAIRKTVLLERLVAEELNKPADAAAQPQRGTDGKFLPTEPAKETPAKKVTSAPPPASELGGKDTPPDDAVESANKSGNFRAYFEAANRRDMQRMKGR